MKRISALSLGVFLFVTFTSYQVFADQCGALDSECQEQVGKPKDSSAHVAWGLTSQTTTGTSVTVAAGAKAPLTEPSGLKFFNETSIDANLSAGSSSGTGVIPVAGISVKAKTKALTIDNSPIDLWNYLGSRGVFSLDFDRNKALDRRWRAGAAGGLEWAAASKSEQIRGTASPLRFEAGASDTGSITPFISFAPEVAGAICPFVSKNRKHWLCLSGAGKARVGLVEAGTKVSGELSYDYKITDDKKDRYLNGIQVSGGANAEYNIDLNGEHKAAATGIAVRVY